MDTQHENRVEHEHRMLECELSETEAARMGRDIAALQGRKRKLEDARKAKAKELKDEIDEVDARIDAIAKALRKGVEERTVEVQVEHDFARNCIRTTRRDTGEVIEERVMPPEARQEEFELDEPEAADATDDRLAAELAQLDDAALELRLKAEQDALYDAQDDADIDRLTKLVDVLAAEIERRSEANAEADEASA